jgi:tetratricopeptide (TPR) repeat protein
MTPLRCLGLPALLVALLLTAGCQVGARPTATLADATSAYERGDYVQAYAFARGIADAEPSEDAETAAYIAGLSAGELGDTQNAIRYLRQAAEGFDQQLAADANVMLGLAYTSQEQYRLAADALLKAADELTGQEQAQAYFYAAVAEQRLGRWATARDRLIAARGISDDPDFRQQIEQRLEANGYTIQVGSFPESVAAQDAAAQLTDRARAIGVSEPRLLPNPARPGQTLVHVGRFTTYHSAQSFRDRLGLADAFIVPIAGE